MPNHRHLSDHEREYISRMTGLGVSLRKIAKFLGRAPSTISREVRRNFWPGRGYHPELASKLYEARKRWKGRLRWGQANALSTWPHFRDFRHFSLPRTHIQWYSDSKRYRRFRSAYPSIALSTAAILRNAPLFTPRNKPHHYLQMRYLGELLEYHKAACEGRIYRSKWRNPHKKWLAKLRNLLPPSTPIHSATEHTESEIASVA
ncbi:hypothetical protein FUAX_03520 [Fulvitalea axinellae]|uniref:Transposase IS30-like HTH domain-containing protein n=1 Tax=Fulvitalea axinellae TaxID=1182444 RepID=A0AAU9D6X7_9BACT|nr:hypothetical protein FUAX_03520 [Fulvitalea axinellae]